MTYASNTDRNNYCNDDKSSAVKLARAYITGLCKEVWTPDSISRDRRELYFQYRNAVKDSTRQKNRIRSFLNEHCVRLPKGTMLTQPTGLNTALKSKRWSFLQEEIIRDKFSQLWETEKRRKHYNHVIAKEVMNDPQMKSLLRILGIRHIIAFTLVAMIGDINRFATHKKLVGYIGLSPTRTQSGNNKEGRSGGLVLKGRKDLRSLLINSAQNALTQKNSPLHKWGWKLVIKKCKNVAAVAVARKLAVSIWHLLKGNFTPLTEIPDSLIIKLRKITGLIGSKEIKKKGYKTCSDYILEQSQLITGAT